MATQVATCTTHVDRIAKATEVSGGIPRSTLRWAKDFRGNKMSQELGAELKYSERKPAHSPDWKKPRSKTTILNVHN